MIFNRFFAAKETVNKLKRQPTELEKIGQLYNARKLKHRCKSRFKNKQSSTTNPKQPENNHIKKWAVARHGGACL